MPVDADPAADPAAAALALAAAGVALAATAVAQAAVVTAAASERDAISHAWLLAHRMV